jgi:hypothetical protein
VNTGSAAQYRFISNAAPIRKLRNSNGIALSDPKTRFERMIEEFEYLKSENVALQSRSAFCRRPCIAGERRWFSVF